ncbi:hypothetical protein C1H46_035593 [Malus baccata]|uniref:Uncharacterized protein n=1 Tax=Malus baccata TaxID=106549 RepID=A0A540KXX5_MALBA|nr:hypothetical protein C1H46_035593 [Malus baccata]
MKWSCCPTGLLPTLLTATTFPTPRSIPRHRSCLLPLPHTLCRSVSDLNHSLAKTSSRSSTSSQNFHFSTDLDSPDSMRLRRMKDRLREMSLWCQQLMREEDLMEEDEDREEQAVEEEQVQIVDDTDQDFHDNATATAEKTYNSCSL